MRARSWALIMAVASLGACDHRPQDVVANAYSAVDGATSETPIWVSGQHYTLVPAEGAYLGLEVSGYFPQVAGALCNAMPYRLALLNELWGGTPYQAGDLSALIASGVFPVVSWGPDPEGTDGTLNAILDGSQDATILAMAQLAASVDGPFFLRFGNEPNGDWSPETQWSWQGFYNGGCTTADAGTCVSSCTGPSQYVAAYIYVWNKFQQAGATNVVWVWSLNVGNEPGCAWNNYDAYYPGDQYVDWIGAVNYNWGNSGPGTQWAQFSDLFSGFVNYYATSNKPIMITETATATTGGDRGQWIINMHDAMETPPFSNVKGVIYVDILQSGVDWELTSNNGDDSLTDFCNAFMSDSYFSPPMP